MPRMIACGLDVGTSKVCCVIGERLKQQPLQIIGLGSADHRGVREGHVIDLDTLIDAIQTALAQAEQEAGVTVRQCTVSVSVPEIHSRRARGRVPLADYGMEVRGRDIDRVRAQAELTELALDRTILHSIPLAFAVDEQLGLSDPVGLVGRQLAVDLLMLTCPQLVLQNVTKAVQLAGLEVQQFVYGGLASAQAVLTDDERERVALIIDLGGSATNLAIMARGRLAAAHTLPVGGDLLTHAVTQAMKVPLEEAESLKRGSILLRPHPAAAALREAAVALLSQLQTAVQSLSADGGAPDVVIVTGRTALLDGLLEMVEERLRLPVRLGRAALPARYFGREPSLSCVTALGLLACQRTEDPLVPSMIAHRSWPLRLLGKARELYEDYF